MLLSEFVKNASNQVVAVNANGLNLYTGGTYNAATQTFSGNGLIINGNGLAGYAGATPTFSINALTGAAYFSGEINSSTLTASTITGGTVQTGSTTATRRIVLSGSSPDKIEFFPKSGDDADTAGYLWVSDDAGSATLPGLVLRPPTKSTWASPPKVKMTQTAAGGYLDTSAVLTRMSGSVWITDSYLQMQSGTVTTFSSVRNISAGATAPSGGIVGDVYFQV